MPKNAKTIPDPLGRGNARTTSDDLYEDGFVGLYGSSLDHGADRLGDTSLMSRCATCLYRQLDTQKLVKLEAILRLLEHLGRLRKVDVIYRFTKRYKPQTASHSITKRVNKR